MLRINLTLVERNLKKGNVDYLTNAPGLDTDDFTSNLNDIERYTVGPQDGSGYDIRLDLTDDELVALLDVIRREKL